MVVHAADTKSCAACRHAGRPHVHPVSAFSVNGGGLRGSCKRCEGDRRIAKKCQADPLADLSIEVELPVHHVPSGVPLGPLPPAVQRTWQPSDGLDMSGPGMPRAGLGRALAIPDCHLPFHSHRGLRLLLEMLRDDRYDLIIQVGDFNDLLSASRYPRSLNVMTPQDETDEARRWGVWLWAEIRNLQPKARLVQLFGNHDARQQKRVLEVLPAIEHIAEPTIRGLYTFEGVELHMDARAEFEWNGVLFHHGHRSFGQHLTWNLRPTVNGHLHRGGVIYKQTEAGVIWELNAGWLGDFESPAVGYIPQKRIHGTTLGVGVVDERGPRFIPFG